MSDLVFEAFDNKERLRHLLVGFDAMAHGFGSILFSRNRNGAVECPFCGKFVKVGEVLFVVCDKCSRVMWPWRSNAYWTAFFTWELLTIYSDIDRFFFPRDWNEGKPWISRGELCSKYVDYLAERYTCSTESIK